MSHPESKSQSTTALPFSNRKLNHRHFKPLSRLAAETEADVFYRDRLPDTQNQYGSVKSLSLFDWNMPDIIKSARNSAFGTEGMPPQFSEFTTVPDEYRGMPVAIIGAGVSGLVAGYELMKLGFQPHFFEMQTQLSPAGETFARPNGRIFSWDFGGNGPLDGAGAGWYPTEALTPESIAPEFGKNVHHWGRRVAELGGMRFPATHYTLRTYVDHIFNEDYHYGTPELRTPWVPFRDPGLYTSTNHPLVDRGGVIPPSEQDLLIYDTAYHTKGIFADRSSPNPPETGGYAELDRVRAGTTLGNSNVAISNLTFKYFQLLFGDVDVTNPYQGILTPILEIYSIYTKDASESNAQAIASEWRRLISTYDSMSLGEVLTAAGWDHVPAYGSQWGSLNISLSEMFGEIGTGTGPFEMFYYSSFMELLRIALQAADSNQDFFLGGPGYMLQPFLTHFTTTKSSPEVTTCLWNETRNKVMTDKVVAIEQAADGLNVTTEDTSGERTVRTYTLALLTASPSAMRAQDIFPRPDKFIPSRTVSYIKRIRINNNTKIAINFPNYTSEPLSRAFWMDRTSAVDSNPNNDIVVTTLTDKPIRQIYTFDNYHWATQCDDPSTGSFASQGTLMINYSWDYNAQSWTASTIASAAREAWRQMSDIYNFGERYNANLEWALANKQVVLMVWEKVDGFNSAWRMAQPGRGTAYGDPSGSAFARNSELEATQVFGMTSFNPEIGAYTGLFIAGEASASPGLGGWVEGSMQTSLQAVAGIVKYLNISAPQRLDPVLATDVSFALQALPGLYPLQS